MLRRAYLVQVSLQSWTLIAPWRVLSLSRTQCNGLLSLSHCVPRYHRERREPSLPHLYSFKQRKKVVKFSEKLLEKRKYIRAMYSSNQTGILCASQGTESSLWNSIRKTKQREGTTRLKFIQSSLITTACT